MRTLSLAGFALALLVIHSGPAEARRSCQRIVGTAVINESLVVPQNATCTLDGTRIEGSIKVEEGGTLRMRNVKLSGDVDARGARAVTINISRIGGDIDLRGGGMVRLTNNTVGDDIILRDNTGQVFLRDNRISGTLQCRDNRQRPAGGGNRVGDGKKEQCERL